MSHTFNSARCYELFCQLFSRSLFHAILNQKRQLTCELYRERHESFGRGNEMGGGGVGFVSGEKKLAAGAGQ